MIVCLIKNIKRPTKQILSTYLYEIQHNVFVGTINYKLFQDFLKHFKLLSGTESATVIYLDKTKSEKFSVLYFNCTSNHADLDGINFFKALWKLNYKEHNSLIFNNLNIKGFLHTCEDWIQSPCANIVGPVSSIPVRIE